MDYTFCKARTKLDIFLSLLTGFSVCLISCKGHGQCACYGKNYVHDYNIK